MSEYPIRVLSLGAGVQSSTLLRMSILGEIEPVQHAIFSDTGWEPSYVYKHLSVLQKEAEDAGIQFHRVSKGNLREDFLNSSGRRWVSIPLYIENQDGSVGTARRQCTNEYKLKPLLAKQRELAGLLPRQRCVEHRITSVIGISWDESQRMRDPSRPYITNEYPLIDLRMTRQDCIAWNAQNGYPPPPKSACVGCPYKGNKEWRALKESPRDWDDAVDFDESMRDETKSSISKNFTGTLYLHRSAVPLSQIDFRTQEEKGQGTLFEAECEGMCGL